MKIRPSNYPLNSDYYCIVFVFFLYDVHTQLDNRSTFFTFLIWKPFKDLFG